MGFNDEDYKNLGVNFLDNEEEIIKNSDIVIQLGLPVDEKLSLFKENQTLIGSLNAFVNKEKLEDLELYYEFYKSGELTEDELKNYYRKTLSYFEELEFKNMLSGEGDKLSAVVQITAGAGGTESCDWAAMLMRMYLMWAEKKKFKISELNNQEGDVTGVKSVTIKIEGSYAFGWLKGENGVHRLVRISPFDSNAKRHTSFASVYVYPLVDDTIDILSLIHI